GGDVLLPHRVEDAALHRLEAVADVGQRPRRDDRERVIEIPRLGGLVERHRDRVDGPAAADQGRPDGGVPAVGPHTGAFPAVEAVEEGLLARPPLSHGWCRCSRYLMNSISRYVASGHSSCGMTSSSASPASRSRSIAGTTVSRMYFACFSAELFAS